MQIVHFRDFPASPKRSVTPDASFGYKSMTLAGGADSVFYHAIHPHPLPGADYWLIGARPIFSWFFYCATVGHPGLSLNIETSVQAVAFTVFNSYPIFADSALNVMEGLFIPGWAARFTLVNSSAAVDLNVYGMLKQQGCE